MMRTFVDPFCGAGAFDIAFEMAGFEPALLCDTNANAIRTLEANGRKGVRADMREVCFPKASLWIAGIPCQAFSTGSQASKSHGVNHKRSHAVVWLADKLKAMRPNDRPDVIVTECGLGWATKNMEGLDVPRSAWSRSGFPDKMCRVNNGGRVDGEPLFYHTAMRLWASSVSRLGYRIDVWILRANHYGNGQNRYRVFSVANRLGIEAMPPQPTHDMPGGKPIPKLRNILRGREGGPCLDYNDKDRPVHAAVPPGGTAKDIDPNMMRRLHRQGVKIRDKIPYRKMSWDGCLYPKLDGRWLIPVVHCTVTDALGSFSHPDEPRPLSVSECAALQGFPPAYRFTGGLASQYMQIGNAVPTEMGTAVARAVMSAIRRNRKSRRGNRPTLTDLAGKSTEGHALQTV